MSPVGEWPYGKFEELQGELASHYLGPCEGSGCPEVWEAASDFASSVELGHMTTEQAMVAAEEVRK
jgi:hypothetical protein